MKELKVAMIATHVADAHTCVLHPASATHRQMNDEELLAAGVSPDLVRLSVGIENVKDIIADLEMHWIRYRYENNKYNRPFGT